MLLKSQCTAKYKLLVTLMDGMSVMSEAYQNL